MTIQTSQWLNREDAIKLFKNEKLVNAIFSSEALKEKRNTEAVEASPNTLVSARVVEYKPAAARSFSEVSAALEGYLKHERAMTLASKHAAETLVSLRQGKQIAGLNWIPALVVERKNAQGLPDEIVKKAFRIDATTPPAFDSIEKKNVGYSLIRVSRVDSAVPTEEMEKKAFLSELQSALSDEYVSAYLASLKSKAKININNQLLNSSIQ